MPSLAVYVRNQTITVQQMDKGINLRRVIPLKRNTRMPKRPSANLIVGLAKRKAKKQEEKYKLSEAVANGVQIMMAFLHQIYFL